MLIQVILVAVFAVALALAWKRAGQGTLSRRDVFLWSVLWIGAAAVVLRPDFATSFARMLGVGRGVDAGIYLSIIALFALAFRIFLRLEKIERDISSLVRTVSIARRSERPETEKKSS